MGIVKNLAKHGKRIFGSTLKKGSHAKIKKMLRVKVRSGNQIVTGKQIIKTYAAGRTTFKTLGAIGVGGAGYAVTRRKKKK